MTRPALLCALLTLGSAFVPHRYGRTFSAQSPQRPARFSHRGHRVRLLAMDYYSELGLQRGADDASVKTAFRKLARQYHPDVNKEAGASEKFKKISNAYEVLSDPESKQRYDMFGDEGVRGAPGGGRGGAGVEVNIEDIFESFFGGGMGGGMGGRGGGGRRQQRNGPVPGEDLRYDLTIDFRLAIFGGQETVNVRHMETCDTCSGSGVKPGSKVRTCATCSGSGIVNQVTRTPLGAFQTQTTCPTCRGSGQQVDEYCGSCSGQGVVQKMKEVQIKIPCGVENGNKLRVPNQGDAGLKGGPSGDLYIFISVAEDAAFKRDGLDLYSELDVTYLDAILGRVKRVQTIDGQVDIRIPAGTQPGTVLRVKNKGVPKLYQEDNRGDQFVTVKVSIPKSLSKEEQSIIEQLDTVSSGASA